MPQEFSSSDDEPPLEDADDFASEADDEEDLPKICPNCMTPNHEFADVCRKCFTPLSSHSTIDPMMSIAARGDTFYKASSQPQKPIVFLGLWLIFGPIGLILGAALVAGILSVIEDPSVLACFGLLLLGFFFFIPAGILVKTTRNYFRPRPEEVVGFPVVEDASREESDEEWDQKDNESEA